MSSPCINEQGFHVEEFSCLKNRFPGADASCPIDAVICEAVNILLRMHILFFIWFVMQYKPRAHWGSLGNAELPQ